ncbi:hypothetical protein A2715_00095 [Candidatus Woesebacteria bacterium RIFCSPHIGHO2_01_FULL_39_32]|uniref:Transcription elongation factor GreA/GreB C-terminal domain-containing protein n=1 Tax=Candidatus Woesebacteria bacterium RIFCSPLOWO2_01_FULL_39_25 TaxID=1802521 RepID=A0A1F8BND9_9BACT|nr:MAG: hypothetical protein A2715_00095 [Candidatus Woesebacteria bacterium RIFCSPHIGHO2_01_FULL_39_32]OGM35475.1 MAG: hypothetical protein A3F01_02325 [Candidatus Woesebacteria bacterium RIFCSPHIGHO2_12_FULL_38_11]OGM65594.1 MAG: hypothetical protein A2893_01555 [Candidatus Woesebacteria bacterium RIFCSPLOWO2_01_FULL_39_25]
MTEGDRRAAMSQAARDELERRLREFGGSLEEAYNNIGEAGGTSDWHDNAALDEVYRQVGLLEIYSSRIQRKLYKPEIIAPREETDDVGIGNKVALRFEGESEPEEFNLLGPADASVLPGAISFESPVGSALIGRQVGDEIEIEVNGQIHRIRIEGIRPGDF